MKPSTDLAGFSLLLFRKSSKKANPGWSGRQPPQIPGFKLCHEIFCSLHSHSPLGTVPGRARLRDPDRLQGLARKIGLGELLPRSRIQQLLRFLQRKQPWLLAGWKGNGFPAGRSQHSMTCKPKSFATQGDEFPEGILSPAWDFIGKRSGCH